MDMALSSVYQARGIPCHAGRDKAAKARKQDGVMPSVTRRAVLGAIAAIVSLLVFHQGAWALPHRLDLPLFSMPPACPTGPVGPLHIPAIASLCFWAGVWGAIFGTAWRGPRGSFLFGGLWPGVVTVLAAFFIVDPLKGVQSVSTGLMNNWIRRLFLNVPWGIGTGLLLGGFLGSAVRRNEFDD